MRYNTINSSSKKTAGLSASMSVATQHDATSLYLKEIGYSPLLTAEEEVRYGRLVHQGNRSARNKLIVSNLRLVANIAKTYRNRGLALLDLIEEGNLGLMHAIEKFDPERGFRFSTYATWWIRQAVERAIMNQSRTVRLPVHIAKQLNSCLRVSSRISQTLDHEPKIRELADTMGKPVSEIDKLLALKNNAISVDMPVNGDTGKCFGDDIADDKNTDPANVIEAQYLEIHIDEWLQMLSAKQRQIVEQRFGLHGHKTLTLEELGLQLDITRERVRQIQLDALKSLRGMMEKKGFSSDVLLD
ncbi:MAG: RNA polymerase sigma factor RpoS [Gammaproteobacteria bacterium]